MRTLAPIAALALALAAPLTAARAETLSLLCHVRESRADGAHRQILRRLDIDLGRKTVRYSDNTGRGWVFKREGPFVSADANVIRLDDSDGKQASVDRRTGQYVFRNQRNGLTIRGPCEKTAAGRPRF